MAVIDAVPEAIISSRQIHEGELGLLDSIIVV